MSVKWNQSGIDTFWIFYSLGKCPSWQFLVSINTPMTLGFAVCRALRTGLTKWPQGARFVKFLSSMINLEENVTLMILLVPCHSFSVASVQLWCLAQKKFCFQAMLTKTRHPSSSWPTFVLLLLLKWCSSAKKLLSLLF